MQVAEFLRTVITTEQGHFCLAIRQPDSWQESWFQWPQDIDKIVTMAQLAQEKADVYFSAHLFSEPQSKKQFVLPSRTIQADLDNADIASVPVMPTVLVETSPGRHQGYWVTDKPHTIASLETLGRKIAYGVPDCDKTGWTAGHKVRLPGTYNLKYAKPHLIEVSGIASRAINAEAFDIFPDTLIVLEDALEDISWAEQQPEKIEVPAAELLAALKGKINTRVYTQFNKRAKDRSAALWQLTCEAFRAGCNRDQVYHLALNSANNKFEERKYNGLIDLRKDILRAERYVSTRVIDLKAVIMDLRQVQGLTISARRSKMAAVVLNHMREHGEFVHCKGGTLWYLLRVTGRPIFVSAHSEWLTSYVSQTFGLNYTEQEHKYVVQELISFTRSLPTSDDLKSLSYFQLHDNTLMLHTGSKSVLHITRHSTALHPNGYASIVFQWGVLGESFTLEPDLSEGFKWWDELFAGCLTNVIGIDRDEALALLRSWLLFLLLRNAASTRPILALFGQQGSGKSTLAKIIYRLFYGRFKSISGLSNGEDFDMDVATMPFVAFDNCDTWQPWLPDRLAQSAGNTAITKRKLYTDMDIVTLDRQALVCVTAHDPKFAREDITDRLLLLMHHRLTHFKSETEILERVSSIRNELWTGIVRDVQRVLGTPKPPDNAVPQFRIEDFARLGYWFAVAESPRMASLFTSGLEKIQARQRSFNIESDYTLVATIKAFIEKRPPERVGKFYPASVYFLHLGTYAPDPESFKRQYKSPQVLGRKLWVMQESLKSLFDIECRDEQSIGTRVWRMDARGT